MASSRHRTSGNYGVLSSAIGKLDQQPDIGTLAARFLDLTKGDRFWPPIQDTAPLIQASRYNFPAYYDPYYKDRTPEQVIVTLDAAGAGVCIFTEEGAVRSAG